MRTILKRIHRILSTFIALALLAGAALAWWTATPGNGLLLVSYLLGALSLIAFLSIPKREDRDRPATAHLSLFGDMRQLIEVATKVAPPVVRSMTSETVALAARMRREDATLNSICAAVEPEYAAWDSAQQEAFRHIIEAILQHQPSQAGTPAP